MMMMMMMMMCLMSEPHLPRSYHTSRWGRKCVVGCMLYSTLYIKGVYPISDYLIGEA